MPKQDATAEKMLNNVTEFIAATQAKPDPRAWDQLLIYCPREALDRRAPSQHDREKLQETYNDLLALQDQTDQVPLATALDAVGLALAALSHY